MDNLLHIHLDLIDSVRALHEGNWDSGPLKQQIADLLKIRDDIIEKLMSLKEDDHECGHG